MFVPTETIVAPASAPGGAVRGIVRISGVDAVAIVGAAVAVDLSAVRVAQVVSACIALRSEFDPRPVAVPVELWIWPHARSYTREPLVELHLIGSPPLIAAVVSKLIESGARLARPGEFTLRAFLAGRMDLIQAEAVLGVIDARDRSQLGQALEQLAGGFSAPLRAVREDLLNLLADVEAGLDFVDEDIEFVGRDELRTRVRAAEALVDATLALLTHRESGDRLPRVVLIGPPNAGKSRLFNALVGRADAIVSPIAGTTRDFLRAELDCDGVRIELIDTAGHDDEAGESPAGHAQRHTRDRIDDADVCLCCFDRSAPVSNTSAASSETAADPSLLGNVARILVATKADLPAVSPTPSDALPVSAEQGIGLDELRRAIAARLRAVDGEAGIAASVRCREGLAATAAALAEARLHAESPSGDEWIAADLRAALDELGQILGAIHTDDLLDRIFSRFCIGK
ncbi:MAG: 50S ribosome-binding GTPase [Pirellulales bacterium]